MFLTKSLKSPFYQVVYEVNGKRTTKSTKTNNQEKAKRFMAEFEQSISIPTTINSVLTLNQFKNEYINYMKAACSNKYMKQIDYTFLKFGMYIGNLDLAQIHLHSIDNFIMSIFSKTPYLAHLHYRILKAAFSKAVDWNYITVNPFKKIKFPRIPKTIPVFITQNEFNIIIAYTNDKVLRDLFKVAFNTGMRLAELVNMRLNWIDFHNRLIKIKCDSHFSTKSKKERIIPMNNNVFDILMNTDLIINLDDYIFRKVPGVKLNNDYVSKNFKKCVRAAGLDDKIHFHTLRHSFASVLIRKGVSLYIIKELLGHEDLSTTQVYSHLQQQNLMSAVKLL